MAELLCGRCGERNPPGTEFCLSCNSFLAWDDAGTSRPDQELPPREPSGHTDPLRVRMERSALTLVPGGAPEELVLTIFNASRIVDRYDVDLPDAPSWVRVQVPELRLNPQHSGELRVRLQLPDLPLVAAGEHRLTVRVRSTTDPAATWSAPLELTVGVVDAPVIAVLEPEELRIVDDAHGSVRLRLDNRNANRPVTFELTGRDVQDALRFEIEPARVRVPAMGTAEALVRITGPEPAPGLERQYRFTLTGTAAGRPVTASVSGTFVQVGSARELRLTVDPARVALVDAEEADFRLGLVLSGGHRPVRVNLRAGDRDNLAVAAFQPADGIELPVDTTGRVRLTVRVPLPEPGQEVTREIQIVATAPDVPTATATVILVQRCSPDALRVRLEPEVVRLQDAGTGRTRLVADNRQGTRPVRLRPVGRDPEMVLGFRFSPPVLQVAAGTTAEVTVELTGPPPPAGNQVSRPFTILPTDDDGATAVSGTLVQSTGSREIRLRPEPARQTVTDAAEADFRIEVEQPDGRPLGRISFRAGELDGGVEVSFHPAVINLSGGSVGRVRMNVKAPAPGPGQEVSRDISVTATAGDSTRATARVTLVQRGSTPALQLRLEPDVLRVRDAAGGRTRLIADNRQGTRPVRLRPAGRDPETVVGFRFSPATVVVPAGQTAGVWVDLTAPAPEPGRELSRSFTIDAGAEQAAAVSGTLVQATSAAAEARLTVRLEPATHELAGRTGSVLVIADNSGGTAPVSITWRGSSSDDAVRFGFDPPAVTVPPGGSATSRVHLTLPRPAPGPPRTRAVTVSGSDGRRTVVASGSVVQVAAAARAWWLPVAVLGVVLMVVGSFLSWDSGNTGLELPLSGLAHRFGLPDLADGLRSLEDGAGKLVSAGGATLLLAALLLVGILRRSRVVAAVFAALGLVFAGGSMIAIGGDPGEVTGEMVAGVGGLLGALGGAGLRQPAGRS